MLFWFLEVLFLTDLVEEYSNSEEDYSNYWVERFLQNKGNEYFCDVDEEFLTDRFNLTGLNSFVPHYSMALDLINDQFDFNVDDDTKGIVEDSATKLYGLIHARFIVTARGLMKMAEKYHQGDFGRCPRVLCNGASVIPHGQSDILNQGKVRLYCPKCEDLYVPKSSRHFMMDGAYFGTTFAPFFCLSYPNLLPQQNPNDQYTPRIFGFKIRQVTKIQRLQYRFMSQDFQILSHRRLGIELPSNDTPGADIVPLRVQHNNSSPASMLD